MWVTTTWGIFLSDSSEIISGTYKENKCVGWGPMKIKSYAK